MKKKIADMTFDNIDRTIPEGKLLSSACAVIAILAFPKNRPSEILELLKDISLRPLETEPLQVTMNRIMEKKVVK